MSMAMPAVSIRMIGSTYTCMMTQANAPVMHIVDTSMIVFAQWLIVNPFSQYNLIETDGEDEIWQISICFKSKWFENKFGLLVGSFNLIRCIAYFAFKRLL